MVEYRFQLNDQSPTELQAVFGESIDVHVADGTGNVVKMWVRFPWSEDTGLRTWREPYTFQCWRPRDFWSMTALRA